MPYVVTLPNGFTISDDRTRLDMDRVLDTLDQTYWGAGRDRATVRRSWDNCLCFGVYAPGGTQAGFARLLTDYALRAHLGDVVIDPAARGLGLGKALIAAILAHPGLASVESWTLTTGDAHGLYERHGFRRAEADGRWMVMQRRVG